MSIIEPPPIRTAPLSQRSAVRGAVARAFAAVDWSFRDSVRLPPHDLHPYPARFIPELPASALRLAGGVDGSVLDPFCGAGTTLVEAVRANRTAVGIDLNPIATLISRTKTTRWVDGDEASLEKYLVELRWAAQSASDLDVAAAAERIPRLDHWFAPTAQRVLAGATIYLETVGDAKWHDRIATAISAAVVRLSRQDSDTRYAAVDRALSLDEGVGILERSLLRVAEQVRGFAPFHSGASVRITTSDAAGLGDLVPPGSVAAAVFSPPYPNAYEYWLYHKYRMYWLGYDPIAVRSGEWGARPHYSGTGKSTIETFREQMRPVMAAVAIALAPDGICFVVVGDSKIKGRIFDNGALFSSIADEVGLRPVAEAVRTIRSTSKSFNPSNGRAKTEHVLLFARS